MTVKQVILLVLKLSMVLQRHFPQCKLEGKDLFGVPVHHMMRKVYTVWPL